MFTVATHALTVGLIVVMFKDQGGGLPTNLSWTLKLNQGERGNTYFAYDLEALAVCEAVVKH
jgi:hypothetical protein